MPHPGPDTFRNIRKIALEKGTAPQGFDPPIPYDPAAGHPASLPGIAPATTYKEQLPHVTDAGAKSIDTPTPFTVKGK